MSDCRQEPIDILCREEFSHDWDIAYGWYRTYNEAMKLWLSCIHLDRPESAQPVAVLYATPERAFADVIQPRVEGQVDLPIISFTMTGASFDSSRYLPVSVPWVNFKVGNKWQVTSKPMPWDLSYNVTVWAKFYNTLDIVGYSLLSRFTPASYLMVSGAASMIEFSGHSDSSQLEVGANKDRILRHDYQFKVNAWMPMPYREAGSLDQLVVVVNNSLTEPDLDALDPPLPSSADAPAVLVIGTFELPAEEINTSLPHKIPGVYAYPEIDESHAESGSRVPNIYVTEQ